MGSIKYEVMKNIFYKSEIYFYKRHLIRNVDFQVKFLKFIFQGLNYFTYKIMYVMPIKFGCNHTRLQS